MKTLLLFLLLGISCFQYTNGQTCTATITPYGSTEFCPPQRVVLAANFNEVGWTEKKIGFPGTGKFNCVAFSILGKGYRGTGQSSDGSNTKDFWEYDPVANTWTQKADFGGGGRRNAVGLSINDKGYLGTGVNNFGKLSKDFWAYDPASNTWSRRADFPGTPRHTSSALSLGNRGFLVGGWDGTYLKDVWEYDPQLDQWFKKNDFPGTARHAAPAFAIGGMGYLGTGISNIGQSPGNNQDFWQYDPVADHWVRKADFPSLSQGRNAGFSIGSKGYIGTGTLADIYNFWEYDPLSDAWVKKLDLPGYRTSIDILGFSIGNKGYAGFYSYIQSSLLFYEYDPASASTYLWSTGETSPSIIASQSGNYTVTVVDGQGCSATSSPIVLNASVLPTPTIASSDSTSFCEGDQVVLSANPGTDTWTWKSNFGGVGRSGAVSFVIGGKAYVGLGGWSYPPAKYNYFWAYDPGEDTWTQRAEFPGTFRFSPAGFSVGNKGYVGTGRTVEGVYKSDFWEYDPLANNWEQKADFAGTPRYQAAAFSIGSKGYLATGYGPAGIYPDDLWEYDPATDHWSQKASMKTHGRAGGVGLSFGGKGYVGMGYQGPVEANTLHDFWEYDPVNDSWLQKANFPASYNLSALLPVLAAFSIGDKGFVSNLEFPKKELWQYDPAYDAWTLKKAFPGPARMNATGFSIGNRGYISMGSTSSGSLDDLWEYKPEDDFTYLWSTGETSPSIIVKTNGSFSVSIQNAQGCSATSASIPVRVGGLFPTPVVIADGPTTFCEGRSVTLSVNRFWEDDPLGSDSADYTFQWSTGDTTTSIIASTAGSYWVRVTNPTGCTQVTDPVEIKTEPSLTPPYIEGATRVCEGQTVPITAIPGSDEPGIQYLWSTGETTQTINSGGGILTVTTTDQNGCTATSEPFDLWVEPLPTLSWDYLLNPDCSGENNGFISIIAQGYTWYFAYTIDNWATLNYTGTFNDLGPGDYQLGVESQTGCRSAIYPVTLTRAPRSQLQITCPAPLALVANEGCNAVNVVLVPPTTTGGCEPITVANSHPGNSFPVGTTIVTWTATDSYGETATCEQTVTVNDETPPTITCPGDIVAEATFITGKIVDFSVPIAADNCGPVTVSQVAGPSSGSLFHVGETIVTFRATDLAQNTVTCSFKVTITPKVCALTTTIIQVSSAPCSGADTGSIIINATNGTDPYQYSIDKGVTYSPNNSFYGLPVGTYQVVVKSGACVTAVHDVTIRNSVTEPLEIECPEPLVLKANANCMSEGVVPRTPLTSGGCPPITLTSSYTGGNLPPGTTVITWEAKDANGQTATCQQVITVRDQTAPKLTCINDLVVQPTSLNGAVVRFSPPAVADNCPGATVIQVAGPPSGAVFPVGITTVTFKATDASGNSATCSFRITVADPYCTNNKDNRKVYVCHNGETICVSVNAVEAHLSHGDQLGQCRNTYTKPAASPVSPGISVFPNPSKGQFTVQLNNMPASDAALVILDAKGRVIESRSVKKAAFPATIQVNLGDRARGMYMIRFVNHADVYTTKIIVE
jgi:N-acetylneuraminic acid mutarotase